MSIIFFFPPFTFSLTPHSQGTESLDKGTRGEDTPETRPFSALSPVNVVARGEVKIGHFDVSRFAKSVGPFAKVRVFTGLYTVPKCV